MDVNDFAADADLFKKKLGVRGFDVRGATKRLLGLADSWASVGQAHLGGLIKITAIPEESRIDGDILGKKFSIQYEPLGLRSYPPAPPPPRSVRGDIRPYMDRDGRVKYEQPNPWILVALAGWLAALVLLGSALC